MARLDSVPHRVRRHHRPPSTGIRADVGRVRHGRARLLADGDGEFRFWALTRAPYPIPSDGPVGPYAEWTRKIAGKTVTRRLSPAELAEYQADGPVGSLS